MGSAQRMREVLDIITRDQTQKLVVLSAMSGTTNDLVRLAELHSDDIIAANDHLDSLYQRYQQVLFDLLTSKEMFENGKVIVDGIFADMAKVLQTSASTQSDRILLAQGELLSTQLFGLLCQQEGYKARVLPALEFMRVDEEHEPKIEVICDLIQTHLHDVSSDEILITQGYICLNSDGEIDNLRRGGSDYTATILGAALNAGEIQIWTDIDGVHNNDPRLVDNTSPIRKMSYREAAELAYFGAKILHPTCVLPAEKMQVPLRLKYTMNPEAPGTLISDATSERPITAIAAKEGITAIKIYSHRMLMAYGFLRKVFQVFENHKTPVDMITTSEVAVSVTIDDKTHLEELIEDLSKYGEVEVEDNYTIICIVGNELYADGVHMRSIFSALQDIPTRMISHGGSKYNVSVLVKSEFKKEALIKLNSIFKSQVVGAE